ncbi:hypothetical protein [Streptomyces mirabilis]|uniref:hypothetical protein n=1 Tax=Streptomyces mirabilis TaxID=68239 RepID=UPI0036D7D13B
MEQAYDRLRPARCSAGSRWAPGTYGSDRADKAVLIGMVPPFLLKAADNPEGVDGQAFETRQDDCPPWSRISDWSASRATRTTSAGRTTKNWTHHEEVDEAPLEFLAA